MIVVKIFPGKTFATKSDLFAALRENVDAIIAVKKADVQKSYEKGSPILSFLPRATDGAFKGMHMKDDHFYPIINTTRYYDGHGDVHFDGLWNKSLKEQDGKIFYVVDHEMKVGSVIAWPEDVKSMVKSVPWSLVGKPYEGNTEALIYEIPKAKIVHPVAADVIKDRRPVQNSVRMMYVKIELGMNSDAKEDVRYKDYYDKRIGEIANREEAEAEGYFFGIEEAKIVKEGSMVLFGSNDATSISQKDIEAVTDTSKTEPTEVTQTVSQFINTNLY
jgi:hypothetical protein